MARRAPTTPRIETTSAARRRYQRSNRREAFSEARLRQIEREEAQLRKAQEAEERERKRKINRQRQEEKEAKERAVQRKLVEEGKISEEQTWGKIPASQRRLNTFFVNAAAGLKRKRDDTTEQADADKALLPRKACSEGRTEDKTATATTTETDRLNFSKPQIVYHNSISTEQLPQPSSPNLRSQTSVLSPDMSRRPQSASPKSKPAKTLSPVAAAIEDEEHPHQSQQEQGSPFPASWEFDIYEDTDCKTGSGRINKETLDDAGYSIKSNQTIDTAEDSSKINDRTLPQVQTFSKPNNVHSETECMTTPTRFNGRKALSQMDVSEVSNRATQKPDTTSAPCSSSTLPSPSPENIRRLAQTAATLQDAAQVLALITSQDLSDDTEEENFVNKENKDPLHFTPAKSAKEGEAKVSLGPAASDSKTQDYHSIKQVDEEEAETDYEDLLDQFEDDTDDYGSFVEDLPEAVWKAATGTPSRTNLHKKSESTIQRRQTSANIDSTPIKLHLPARSSPPGPPTSKHLGLKDASTEGEGKGKGKAKENLASSFSFEDVSDSEIELVMKKYDSNRPTASAGMQGTGRILGGYDGVEEWD
ncbi:MAG: hypothetical protein Q9227_000171 [Pyrenula ochraceoflavens]